MARGANAGNAVSFFTLPAAFAIVRSSRMRGNKDDDSRGNLRFHRHRRRLGGLPGRRRGSANPGATACCCSKPAAARHATRGSTSRSATPRPTPTRGSTGCSRASPRRSSTAAPSTSRAARCWAAPARSTAWSTCAARRPITTTGASAAARAGIGTSVLPFFKKAEDQERGADEFHGVGGPLQRVEPGALAAWATRWSQAAIEAGIPANPDFNGARQEGVGYYQTTTGNRRRWSAAQGLSAARRASRPNLTVATNAHADPHPDRGRPRGRGRIPDAAGPRHRALPRRDRRFGRGLRLAAAAATVGARARRRCCSSSASRWCATCPGSAPICTTISTPTWCGAAPSRSRSTIWR